MKDIDITVVIPTFRRPDQVVETIESALAQENVSIEVLVVDDSPEGSAREPVEAIGDPRVAYTKRSVPSHGRPAVVRNDAWPGARGRYVHFLDDDDVVVPGAYRAHVDALDASPGSSMSFGRIEAFGSDEAATEREKKFWNAGAERARRAARMGRFALVATLLFEDAILQNSACMVRKSALAEIGGFDVAMPVQEDTEMHARGTRLHGSLFLDRPVIRYRVNPRSLMRAGDVERRLRESYARMHKKYRDEHGRMEFTALRLLVGARSALSRFAVQRG